MEKIAAHSEGERAGLEKGDILLAWSSSESKGEIHSPFDVAEIEAEQAPLGAVKVEGLRGAEKQTWFLGPDGWGLMTRPNFAGDTLKQYLEGSDLATTGKPGDVVEASKRWEDLAGRPFDSSVSWLPAWLFFHAAEALREAKRWSEADGAYQQSLRSASGAGSVVEGQLFQVWARAYEQRSDWPNAEKYYQQSIIKLDSQGHTRLAITSSLDALGRMSYQHGDFDSAEHYLRQALDVEQKLAPGSLNHASTLHNLGNLADDRGDLAAAEKYYQQALDIRVRLVPQALVTAATVGNLGNIAFHRGDLIAAEERYTRALEIQQKLAPDSRGVAAGFCNLGLVAWKRGDWAQAEQYYRRSLDLEERLTPGGLDVADNLTNLGILAHDQGNLAEAERYYRQALDIEEKLAPGSLNTADSLNNLGNIASDRGDLATAEQYDRQALKIKEKLAPGSLDFATSLNNLGNVASDRGDLGTAERCHRQALEIMSKLAPGSLDEAAVLTDLGNVARKQGDLDRAEQYHREALEIKQKLAPGTLDEAASLTDLGNVATDRGDFSKAEQYHREALAIYEKLAPDSVSGAEVMHELGNLARQSGDLAQAEQYFRRSVGILERLAPGGAGYAESLAGLAAVLREQRQPELAAQFYLRAVDALESQTARLGGSEDVRSGFRARFSAIYKDYIDLLLEQKQPERALEVLEGSRARILLEMLAAAHIDIHKGADPSLLKQERSLNESLIVKSTRRLQLMGEKGNEKKVAVLTQEIEVLKRQDQEVEEQLRLNSPVYAALTQPRPLTTAAIHQLLDNDTLLLEYSLGSKRSYVFLITRESLSVYELPSAAELESKAKHLYDLLALRDRSSQAGKQRIAEFETEYMHAASNLSHILIGPLAADLNGKRLIIVSDGALQYVPFAALPAPQSSGESAPPKKYVPLIADHEVVELPSASVLAALRTGQITRQKPPRQVVVLADPVFDAKDVRVRHASGARATAAPTPTAMIEDVAADSQSPRTLMRSLTDLNLSRDGNLYLPRLAFTRREAAAIVASASAGMGRAALDFDATRALALSGELANYRVVHFATHALVDHQHPELSGLVLSLVDTQGNPQDGFLDLQDIYNLNLAADLVVLSACDTALGKQINGEGMIGLTRGFMYAGASRVVASLWRVDDVATAELMKRFYRAMQQQGLPPAAALRQAQIGMWKQGDWKSPYYWAAFQLQGEWK